MILYIHFDFKRSIWLYVYASFYDIYHGFQNNHTYIHWDLGQNFAIHTFQFHRYLPSNLRNKTSTKTSKTNCYVAMYVCMFVDFHRYVSCEHCQTYMHTFRCNNFLTPQISLYVSKTTINTMQKRFKAQARSNCHVCLYFVCLYVCMFVCLYVSVWMHGGPLNFRKTYESKKGCSAY